MRLARILALSLVSAVYAGHPPVDAPGHDDNAATLLEGPDVPEDSTAPGAQSTFSMAMDRPREMERPIPLQTYLDELKDMRREDVSPEIRIDAQLDESITGIVRAHRKAVEEHMRSFDVDVRALRQTAWGDRRRGEGGTEAQEPRDADSIRARDEARATLRRMRSSGPQDSDLIAKIWDTLDEAQRAHLEARFEAIRVERAMAQAERQTKNDIERRERRLAARAEARKNADRSKEITPSREEQGRAPGAENPADDG